MKYSLNEIVGSLPAEKRKADGTVTTVILRPLSWPAAWLFLRLGASPNAVTALSALFSAAGLALTMTAVPALHALAVGFFFVFGVLDCADGNMARTIGAKNPFGGWVDAARITSYNVCYTKLLRGFSFIFFITFTVTKLDPIMVSTVTCAVNALVDATPISIPAWV